MVLMHFPDVLTLFNRMGIRPVNDVTAQFTANVTAAMDPEGMGVHMGPSAAPLPLGEDGKEVPAAAQPLVCEMATKNELLVAFADISKVMSNALVTSSKTIHDSSLNVIVHKVGEMKQYVDDKVTGIDDKMVDIDDKMVDIDDKMVDIDDKMVDIDDKMVDIDDKVATMKTQFEKRLASLEKPQKKSKKPKTKTRSTVSPNISFANGSYCWRKTISKKPGYKGAYKTIDEAKQGLQQFCQE